jgi:hypothetical protein
MKRLLLILTVLMLERLAAAEARPEVAPHPDRFDLVGPHYKAVQELPPTFFNPFKSQTTSAALARKETPTVTNEAVAEAVTKRGVSGIVLSPDLRANRVVVGDEVFGVDDELSFPDPKRPEAAPLVGGATVVLRAIRRDNLEFEIRVEGEAARTLTFPLRRFWAR